MTNNLQNKNIGLCIIFFYLLGMLCGLLMIRLQLTDAAKEGALLLTDRLLKTPAAVSDWNAGVGFAMRLCLPCLLYLAAVFCFGLWMLGQPFVLFLFAMWGFFCGSYGMTLLNGQQSLFMLAWYLPFAVLTFFALLPVGSGALMCGTDLLLRQKERAVFLAYLRLTVKQAVILLLICVLAALGYGLYGGMLRA